MYFLLERERESYLKGEKGLTGKGRREGFNEGNLRRMQCPYRRCVVTQALVAITKIPRRASYRNAILKNTKRNIHRVRTDKFCTCNFGVEVGM